MSNFKQNTKILMEFIGTFLLTSSINLSTTYDEEGIQTGNPLLIILTFFSAITLTRAISGGHINPAVSLAVHFDKPQDVRSNELTLLILYIVSQVLGAVTACFFSFIFYRENVFKLALSPNATPLTGFLIELICTFIFIYTILCQGI
jgi:glycerol uptake facilitator-like aquaporin